MENTFAVGHVIVIAFFRVFQTIHSAEISGSGNYITPNACYTLTCSFNDFLNDRTTLYQIKKSDTIILYEITVRYFNSTGQCYYRNGDYVSCTTDLCSCDSNGMANRICYNHTSEVIGNITLLCVSGSSSEIQRSVLAGPGESMTFKPPYTDVIKVAEEKLDPIICAAMCTPACRFHWTTPSGENFSGPALEKTSLNKGDHGIYQCKAWNTFYPSGKTKNLNLTIYYGPESVSLLPNKSKYTLTEGKQLGPVVCDAECRPQCTINWSGPNVPNSKSGILTIPSINRTQNGVFYCTASNQDANKTGNSSFVTVDVQYGPGISIQFDRNITTITKTKGERLGPIICSATCNPVCHFKWTKPDNTTINGRVIDIAPLVLSHHGIFTCIAWNGIGDEKTKDLSVTINYGPEFVTYEPNRTNYNVTEGYLLGSIICNADCRPSCIYSWFGPHVSQIKGGNLTITNIHKEQTGAFYCSASNQDANKTANSSIITVDVQYGPGSSLNLEPNSERITKNKGERLGPIVCSATCNPVCHFNWTKPDQTTTNGSVIDIAPLTLKHHGIFTCTAWNAVSGKKTKDLNVTINYGPEVVTISPNTIKYTLTEGSTLGPISCNADCRPECTYTWFGPNIPESINTNLSISTINRKQNGAFYCGASNVNASLTANSSSLFVDVQYRANVTHLQINSTNMTVSENTTVVFSCRYNGNPIPNITWSLNEQVLQWQEGSGILDEYVFSIKSAKCYDIGKYTCFAENNIGISSKDNFLYVNCPPRSLTDLKDSVAIKNKTSSLNLTVAFISFPKPTDIKWYFSKNKTAIKEAVHDEHISNSTLIYRHQSVLIKKELTDADYGYYSIEITNGIGNAFHHIFKVVPETVPDRPDNVTAFCKDSSSSIIISWKAGFNGGQNQKFDVWFRINSQSTSMYKKYQEKTADPGRGEFETITVTTLQSQTPYVLYVNASNINGYSLSKEVYCNTTSELYNKDSNSAVIGVAAGTTSAIIVLIAVIFFVVLFRKLHKGIDTKDKRCLTEKVGDSLDELPDNPDYISADTVTYSVVNKITKGQRKPDMNMQYEDVNLSGPDVSQAINVNNTGAEYAAVVKKSTKGNESNNQHQKKKQKKKKGKNFTGQLELGDIYMNTEKTADESMIGGMYGNTGCIDDCISNQQKKNKDGLIYADLDLAPTPSGKKFIIRGLENRNNYAIIDLTKSAEPLPSDDEEEEQNDAVE